MFPWHCQVDVERTGSAADDAMTQTSDSATRHLTPNPEGPGAQQAMVGGPQQVTAETEQIQHDAVHREETLRVRGGGEPPQVALALPGRLVRHLRSIVPVLPGAVNHGRHDGAVRCGVAA